jgi:ribonucleoside-triphosphate reductase
MANFLGILQSEWAGAQAFSSFDTFLAPYVFKDKMSFKSVKKAIRGFVYNLNVPSRWGQSPFTNITIDWTVPDDLKDSEPISGGFHLLDGINDQELISKAAERGVEALEEMTYKHFQPEMNMIQKAYYEVMTEGDSTGQPFTFPIPTVNITEEFDWDGENVLTLFENTAKIGSSYFQNFVGSQYKIDENGNRVEDEEAYKPSAVRSMCCRLQLDLNELRKRGNGLFGSAESTGSIGVVTINLARLGYKFKGDKRGLYKELDRLMVMAKSTLEKKRVVVAELFEKGLYPYTKRYLPGGYRNHFSTIGVNGGNEMIRNFTDGKHDITSKWGAKFAEDLLNYIRKRMKDFQNETGNLYNLEASPGEGATHRFAREDAKRYPDIIQAGCKETGKIYYTNSTQLPSWYTDDLFMALKLQDTLQTRYTGGTVFHMYMSEMVSSPEACRDIVRKILTNFKMPYITVTPLFSVCEKHGYLKGRHDYCPICDDEIIQEARSKCNC